MRKDKLKIILPALILLVGLFVISNTITSKKLFETDVPIDNYSAQMLDRNTFVIYENNQTGNFCYTTFNIFERTQKRTCGAIKDIPFNVQKEKTPVCKINNTEQCAFDGEFYFGGIKNGAPTKEIYQNKRKSDIELAEFAINPEIYYMSQNYNMIVSEYIIVDKTNIKNPVQACTTEGGNYDGCWVYSFPKRVKNSKLDSVVKISSNVLLFIFKDKNTRHFVLFSYPDYENQMKYLGHKKTNKKNQKYLAINYKKDKYYDDERVTPRKIELLEIGKIDKKGAALNSINLLKIPVR